MIFMSLWQNSFGTRVSRRDRGKISPHSERRSWDRFDFKLLHRVARTNPLPVKTLRVRITDSSFLMAVTSRFPCGAATGGGIHFGDRYGKSTVLQVEVFDHGGFIHLNRGCESLMDGRSSPKIIFGRPRPAFAEQINAVTSAVVRLLHR